MKTIPLLVPFPCPCSLWRSYGNPQDWLERPDETTAKPLGAQARTRQASAAEEGIKETLHGQVILREVEQPCSSPAVLVPVAYDEEDDDDSHDDACSQRLYMYICILWIHIPSQKVIQAYINSLQSPSPKVCGSIGIYQRPPRLFGDGSFNLEPDQSTMWRMRKTPAAGAVSGRALFGSSGAMIPRYSTALPSLLRKGQGSMWEPRQSHFGSPSWAPSCPDLNKNLALFEGTTMGVSLCSGGIDDLCLSVNSGASRPVVLVFETHGDLF